MASGLSAGQKWCSSPGPPQLRGNVSQACEESDTAIPEETEADIQHEGDDGKLEGPRPEDQEEDPAPFDADEPKCACRLVASTPAAGSAGSPSGDVTAEASGLL